MIAALVSNNEALNLRFTLKAKPFNVQIITLNSLEKATLEFKNRQFDGLLIDIDIFLGTGVDLQKWSQDKGRFGKPILFINKVMNETQIEEILKKLLNSSIFYDKVFRGLLQEYQDTIKEKMRRIDDLYISLSTNFNLKTLNALKFEIHKIAGSAGSYGYSQVSDLSKELECVLNNKINNPSLENLNEWLCMIENTIKKIKQGFSYEQ